MSNLIPWILAGAGLAAAVALVLRLRDASAVIQSTRELAESLADSLAERTQALERTSAKLDKQAEDNAVLRHKLDKARRRASSQEADQSIRLGSHAPALEKDLETARRERDAAREEASRLGAELARVRAELAAVPAPPEVDAAGIAALRARVERAEAAAEAARRAQAADHDKLARLKAKVASQDQLYASVRGELEAKKDRLRTQQEEIERLQALRVSLGAAPEA